MRNELLIASAAFGIAQLGAPAGAQEAGNPLDVTWSVDAPVAVEPLAFALSDRADFEVRHIPIRMPAFADPGPSVAADAWRGEVRFAVCDADTSCGANPGRLGLRVRSDGAGGVKFGALVRLGEDIAQPSDPHDTSWRFFAAADAHAVTWDLRRGGNGEGGVHLEDKLLVGDAQVGFARPVGPADLTLGFIHREVSAEGASRNEQFAGVTFAFAH